MNIKELRLSTGMTQSEFGKCFNIPMRTIQNWEGGKRNCPKYLAELIEYKLEKEEIGMKKRRTFEDFLQIIHGMGYAEYLELNVEQKKALESEYKDSYK